MATISVTLLDEDGNERTHEYDNAGFQMLEGGGIHIFSLGEYELLVHISSSDHWETVTVKNIQDA